MAAIPLQLNTKIETSTLNGDFFEHVIVATGDPLTVHSRNLSVTVSRVLGSGEEFPMGQTAHIGPSLLDWDTTKAGELWRFRVGIVKPGAFVEVSTG